MIRELIKPVDNVYVLNLPDEMIGKTVEIIAFEVENSSKPEGGSHSPTSLQDIENRYGRYPVISHNSYKFNRDEANDYE
jgi:hypothetical protein